MPKKITETSQKSKTFNPSSTTKISKEQMISLYMESVLKKEKTPTSVFNFARENNFTEAEFYAYFGSFGSLQTEIWNSFYHETIRLANQEEEYDRYSNKEKMLTFFYTFFEILTLNRSYVLFVFHENKDSIKNISQLKELRTLVKTFSKSLIENDQEGDESKIRNASNMLFSEGTWVQTLILLKYWLEDNSANFEKTDIAIEKSVRVLFDVFDTKAFESVVDFGKFLWKESKL